MTVHLLSMTKSARARRGTFIIEKTSTCLFRELNLVG
nr:MAG TPA: hypothetical protein [Bacteriophage sp.]